MATRSMTAFVHQLRRSILVPDGAGLTDGQLLTLFIEKRDEGAFEALLRRHGPMVMGVCRRVLGNEHDGEDAFQASFLVLVRKAASILPREMVANWLHGVAYMTAQRAKVAIAKRRVKERQVMERPAPKAVEQELWLDLLDQELKRLPEKYRIVLVLCDLEGKTRNEVARQLGYPEGTVASRLARARRMLAKQLTRHGLKMSGGALAAMLSQNAASACLSTWLVLNTIKAARLFAAGQVAATGMISTQVAALTEGVLKTMLLSKLKVAVVMLLAIGALGIGASALPYRTVAAEPASSVSKSAVPRQDEGNLKETVLALEKRIWEAHSEQDVDAFKNLLADDFVGIDANGHPYDKPGTLDFVARFRVLYSTMRDVKVIVLNATSAIVSYEVHCKIRPTEGQDIESTTRRVTSAWTQRKGRWWYVYGEDKVVQKDAAFGKVIEFGVIQVR